MNCLDQTTSNFASGAEANIMAWTDSVTSRDTFPAAYDVFPRNYVTNDVTSQIVLGDVVAASNFEEPCTIELEQDTSQDQSFSQNSQGSFTLLKQCNEVSQCNEALNESYQTSFPTWPTCLSYDDLGKVDIDNCSTVGDYSITFTCETLGVQL